MILTFRPIDKWPENWKRGTRGKANPFGSAYASTLDKLDFELEALRARDAYLQIDMDGTQLRLDGQPRAGAKANYRGVILTIDSAAHGILSYSCDAFEATYYRDGESWQCNLRAVALGLEALRQLDRYGIAERGQQYAGFAQLGSGIAMGVNPGPMSKDEAIRIIKEGAGLRVADYAFTNAGIEEAYRRAVKVHHPDAGGDAEVFRKLTEARDLLIGSPS